MPIPQFSTPPSRNQGAEEFTSNANTFLGEFPAFVDAANALQADVNEKAVQTNAAAESALNSRIIATAVANYVGEWTNQTGGASVPVSVSHNDKLWYLKEDVADVTLVEPGTATVWGQIDRPITKAVTSGASQSVTFGERTIHLATADADTVTFTFVPVSAVARVELILNVVSLEDYYIETPLFDDKSFLLTTQDAQPRALQFKPDGTKMYMLGFSNDTVYQYSLSVPWSIDTASYDGVSFSVATQVESPYSMHFKPDGTKLFVLSGFSTRTLYEYVLSTAWDLSTLSYNAENLVVNDEETQPRGLSFKDDGTQLYVVGQSGHAVFQYNLPTAWSLNAAFYSGVSFSVATEETNNINEIEFRPDGLRMFLLGTELHQYTLTTAWDISTASYDAVTFPDKGRFGGNAGFVFGSSGKKIYLIGSGADDIAYQFTASKLSTLVFPTSLETPGNISIRPSEKTALSIVTADDGVSYQTTTVQEGIK